MSVDLNTFLNKIAKEDLGALKHIVFEGTYDEGLVVKVGKYLFYRDITRRDKYAFHFKTLDPNARLQPWSTSPDAGSIKIDSIALTTGISGKSCIIKLGRRITRY